MRNFMWGQYPAQRTDFSLRQVGGGSAYVDRRASNSDNAVVKDASTFQLFNNCSTSGFMARNHFHIALANIRAALGHTPVIVSAKIVLFSVNTITSAYELSTGLYRLVTIPNLDNASARYYDLALSLPWGGDPNIYAPVPGQDHLESPFATIVFPAGTTGNYQQHSVEITSELAYCLQAATDMWFMWTYSPIGVLDTRPQIGLYFTWNDPASQGYHPYVTVRYMNPLEFFACNADGSIDLKRLLDNSAGTDINSLYLGAVEIGQAGTPVTCRIKNLGTRALPHLEIWDDEPEWTTPAADVGNTGTAALGYVMLADAGVSQKYTIKFTSATDYQVKAEAYKNNTTNLNPTYGTVGWTGAVGADFVAPSGGLTIPTAGWSGTAVANDFFVVYVTGNTTDTSWPLDSNDQIQIAKDNGFNAPDATTWRPICGHRTILGAPVTIDNTSKTITVRYINPTQWPNGTKVFVANANTIDEGVIAGQTATSLTITFPSATGNAYVAGDKVASTLPIRNLATSTWAKTTGAAGASQANPAWIPLAGAATIGFAAAQVCSIQSVDDTSIQETFTVSTADSTHILATAYLTNDYTTGAVVIVGGSGEAQFWLRIVATSTTLEERKQLRMSVRT